MSSDRIPGAAACVWRLARTARSAARLLAVAGMLAVPVAASASIAPEVAAKLDARLMGRALVGDPLVSSVWVTFADKGERGPADLAAALGRARAELSPRSLERRRRTGVDPLVDYRDVPVFAPYLEELRARGLAPYGVSRWLNRAAVRVPGTRLAELAGLPFVARLLPVERAMRTPDPPDPVGAVRPAPGPECGACAIAVHSLNYGLNAGAVSQLNVPAVHDSGYIGTGVLVCILDDGFNFHDKDEALAPVVIAPGFERDFVDGDWYTQDTLSTVSCYHGTWVMGCIAGNKPGTYVGTAPGARYAIGRTEVDTSETPVEMVYWGMGAEWADSLGADLITTSLGYSQFDGGVGDYTPAQMDGHTTIVAQAAEIAASKGILVLASAGNDGSSPWQKVDSPADVNGDSLIAVGAVNSSGVRASFSSKGPTADGRIKPDLMALGVSNNLVGVSGNPQGYEVHSGTSFSAPLLAGLAACMIQARPGFTPTTIIRSLRETSSRAANPDTLMGYGIPDGLKALRWSIPGLGVSAPPPTAALGIRLIGPNPHPICDPPSAVQFAIGPGASAEAHARVVVYDAGGRRIVDLFDGSLTRGQWREASWDGRDAAGRPTPTGLYFIALEAAGHRSAVRVVSLR